MESKDSSQPPTSVLGALYVKSEEMPDGSAVVKGYDFNEGVDYHKLFTTYNHIGFQAQHLGMAIKEVNRMIEKRKEPLLEKKEYLDEYCRPTSSCTIFLGYTSNLISCGLREVIRFLVEHKMVDCLVTTCGGIEEDIIKCMGNFYIGDFRLQGATMRSKGLNRTGNLIVPNDNYCKFESWLGPVLDQMLEEQKTKGTNWTPSKMIHRFGREINNKDSVYYWAYKNNIPVFCPAITDGAIGDVIYCNSYRNPGLIVDIAEDIVRMNNLAVYAINSGMIILGGGVIKHHICNANLTRNGADFSVYVNTANEFDGSDAGASPDEAVSWGKIKATAQPVKVVGDASLIFPILVGETFARDYHMSKDNGDPCKE